jgi:membrane-associated HD superfamily phosphohydrolase
LNGELKNLGCWKVLNTYRFYTLSNFGAGKNSNNYVIMLTRRPIMMIMIILIITFYKERTKILKWQITHKYRIARLIETGFIPLNICFEYIFTDKTENWIIVYSLDCKMRMNELYSQMYDIKWKLVIFFCIDPNLNACGENLIFFYL